MSIEQNNNEQEKDDNFQSNIKKKDYEILLEDYSYFDLSFKIILIGNSGKILILIIIKYDF